jgi:aspartyl-tRNA(Asn)/glutamyl-tRNA(Gln) amidotransferase subunit C
MQIDQETITKIAHLARLEIADHERESILEDLNNVLNFMSKLNELCTDHVKPLVYMTDEVNVLREDQAKHELCTEEVLQNAPKHDEKYFKVPKVISKG